MKLLILLFSLLALPAMADQDDDFLAARDAYKQGNAKRLDSYARQLRDYELNLYVQYYQLSLGLESAEPNQVLRFLARSEDSPLQDKMRVEWLKLLGKQQKWSLFSSEFNKVVNSDNELQCYALQARAQTHSKEAMREARGLWFTGKDMPSSCDPMFQAALNAGVISEDDAWKRFRLALESNNLGVARRITERLSPDRRTSPGELDAAARNPVRFLNNAHGHSEGDRALQLFALQRIAKQSPDQALSYWNPGPFTREERQYFYGWLGYEGVRKQHPTALKWYKQAGNNLNDEQLAWRARAALRETDWQEVLGSINMMNDLQQQEGTWRYWKGRALLALGKSSEAMKLLAPLSNELNFYGQLANEELSKNSVIGNLSQPFQPNRQILERIGNMPGVRRTVALYRVGLRGEATKEWGWAIRNFNDNELLNAAEFARRNEMYDRSIGAADKTVSSHDFSLRFPAPYREELEPYIQDNRLDDAWVYGLMRQESRFANVARSNVGATGLMQVMPSTARWIARKMGWSNYRDHMLSNVDVNLKMGTFYMRNILSTFDNSPVLAAAAYNAGPGRARRWRGDQPLEGAIYAETIPFEETRDYVKKVMSNTLFYAIQFGAPWRSLKTRLGIIAAKNPDNQRALPDEK